MLFINTNLHVIHVYNTTNHNAVLHPDCMLYLYKYLIFHSSTPLRLHASGKQIINAIKMFSYLQELEICAFKINY
jgi:hypothetical protein